MPPIAPTHQRHIPIRDSISYIRRETRRYAARAQDNTKRMTIHTLGCNSAGKRTCHKTKCVHNPEYPKWETISAPRTIFAHLEIPSPAGRPSLKHRLPCSNATPPSDRKPQPLRISAARAAYSYTRLKRTFENAS